MSSTAQSADKQHPASGAGKPPVVRDGVAANASSTATLSTGDVMAQIPVRQLQGLRQNAAEQADTLNKIRSVLADSSSEQQKNLWARFSSKLPWRRIRSLRQSRQLVSAQFQYQYHIEYPTNVQVTQPAVTIYGWVFSLDGTASQALRAIVGRKRYAGKYPLLRQDVADFYPHIPGNAQSGFTVKVLLTRLHSDVVLELQGKSGRWRPFAKLSFTVPRKALSASLWRRLGFWLCFPFNQQRAWALLQTGGRARLVTAWEAKGRLTLGNLRQFPPRPLHPERFPRRSRSRQHGLKFTIVTPSFNQGRFLARTMTSVIGQRYTNLDYIVQDGASTDESVAIIKRHESQLKYWSSEKDSGQSDALVRGFAHMDCGPHDIMAYLNSDDMLMPGALDYVAAEFACHPELDVIYGHRVMIDETDREIGRWVTPRHDPQVLAHSDLVPQETLFWRRRIYDRAGGIDPSFHFAMDWDLLVRFSAAGARMRRVPYFLGLFRVHDAQKTSVAIDDIGKAEMDRIRASVHGAVPPFEEVLGFHDQARMESAILTRLLRIGIRL